MLKNGTYYLISSNKKELKENDIYFSNSQNKIGTNFNENYFQFTNNQIINLKLSVEYFEKETSALNLTHPGPSLRNCDREAGTCGTCEYKMEKVTGALIKKQIPTINLIDFDIIINGRNYPISELKPKLDDEGNFIVTLDLKNLVLTDLVSVEFHQNAQLPVLKNIFGYDYSLSCFGRNDSSTIDITPSIILNLEANILGRKITNL